MHGWAQILLGGVLGASLWGAVGALSSPAQETRATEPPIAAESAEETLPMPPPLPVATPAQIAAATAVSPTPTPTAPIPTPQVSVAPPLVLPILRGTMVGTNTLAIFEFQGTQRVVKEGEYIGPFVVGGVYPKQASLSLRGQKFFMPLIPQTAYGSAQAASASGDNTEQWVKSLVTTQVMRDGVPVGLILRKGPGSNADSPFQQYGVYEGDIVKAVNNRAVRSQADLWWVHQELQHAPRFEMTVERGGQEQTLRQERWR